MNPARIDDDKLIPRSKKKRLGEILLAAGLLDRAQLHSALKESKQNKQRLGTVLLEKKMITEEVLAQTLADHLGYKYIVIADTIIEPEAILMVPEHLVRKHMVVPISYDNGSLVMAMADPLSFDSISAISFYTGSEIRPVLSTVTEIKDTIDRFYDDNENIENVVKETLREFDKTNFQMIPEIGLEEEEENVSLEERSRLAPIIRLTNLIISTAIKKDASDIHIEPEKNHVRVRYRIDGILKEEMKLPKWSQGAIVSRIKILARLDITERRIPQDGGIRIKLQSRSIDLRISTLPTNHGEKVVIRILMQVPHVSSLSRLGLFEKDLESVQELIKKKKGLIVVTGPTGSGKTTSLYTILSMLKSESRNIITVENPVEYNIPGVTQVQIDTDAGRTFNLTLRAILRQDPDIILLGEIRDTETAELAIRAAMTGHLVFSTLHTNDAVSTISRLRDLGIPNFLIALLLMGIVAQRLVRKICPKCKTRDMTIGRTLTPELKAMGITQQTIDEQVFYYGAGCNYCDFSGYKGRTGIFEILRPNQAARELIYSGASDAELNVAAISNGMTSICWDGILKVKAGITTLDELTRVIEIYDEFNVGCDNCGKVIRSSFMLCPYCGTTQGNSCDRCGKVLEAEWAFCPYCKSSIKQV